MGNQNWNEMEMIEIRAHYVNTTRNKSSFAFPVVACLVISRTFIFFLSGNTPTIPQFAIFAAKLRIVFRIFLAGWMWEGSGLMEGARGWCNHNFLWFPPGGDVKGGQVMISCKIGRKKMSKACSAPPGASRGNG